MRENLIDGIERSFSRAAADDGGAGFNLKSHAKDLNFFVITRDAVA